MSTIADLQVAFSSDMGGLLDDAREVDSFVDGLNDKHGEIAITADTDQALKELHALKAEADSMQQERPLSIDVDGAQAEAELRRLEELSASIASHKTTLTIDAAVDGALRDLSQVETIMQSVSHAKAVVQVQADTERAHAELLSMQKTLDSLRDRPGIVEVKAEVDQALRGISEVRSAMMDLNGTTAEVNTTMSESGGMLGGIAKNAAGMASGIGIANVATMGLSSAFGFAKNAIFGLNSTLETSSMQFETLMGSADKARAHVLDLFEFAKETPFETQPVIEASRMLELFGHAALDTTANLTMVGDAAASSSASIEEVAFWVGRMYSSMQGGQPFGESAMRLQELGILSAEERVELEKMQKAGAGATEMWNSFTGSLDRLAGSMAKQASTWKGLTSTFSDFINLTASHVMAPFFQEAEAALSSFLKTADTTEFAQRMDEWQGKARDMAGSIHDFVVTDGPALVQSLKDAAVQTEQLASDVLTLSNNLKSMAGPAVTIIKTFQDAKNAGTFDIGGYKVGVGSFSPLTMWSNLSKGAHDYMGVVKETITETAKLGDSSMDAGQKTRVWEGAYEDFVHLHADEYVGRTSDLITDARTAADAAWEAQEHLNHSWGDGTEVLGSYGNVLGGVKEALNEQQKAIIASSNTMHEEAMAALDALVQDSELSGEKLAEAFAAGIGKGKVTVEEAVATLTAGGFDQSKMLAGLHDLEGNLQNEYAVALASGSDKAETFAGQLKAVQDLIVALSPSTAELAEQTRQHNGLVAQGIEQWLQLQHAIGILPEMLLGTASAAEVLASNMSIAAKQAVLTSQAVLGIGLARDSLAGLQTDLGDTASVYATQASGYQSDMQGLAAAKDAINQKIADGIPITAQDQTFLDQYDGLYARLAGGVSDATIQEGDAIAAKVNVMQAQEDLNKAIADGSTNLQPYQDKLKAAQDVLAGAQEHSPLENSLKNLNDTMAGPLKQSIDEMTAAFKALNDLHAEPTVKVKDEFTPHITKLTGDLQGFDSKQATPKVTLDHKGFDDGVEHVNTELGNVVSGKGGREGKGGHSAAGYVATIGVENQTALDNIRDVDNAATGYTSKSPFVSIVEAAAEDAIGDLTTVTVMAGQLEGLSPTITPNINLGPFFSAVDTIHNYMPHSPAKEGPLKKKPNWDWLFEDIPSDAKDALDQMASAFTGALGDIDSIVSGAAYKDAKKQLDDLFAFRDIAEGLGLTNVVKGLDAQIAAQQDNLKLIGAAMGSDIIQGMVDAAKAADVAKQILDTIKDEISNLDVGSLVTGGMKDMREQQAELIRTRDALRELGYTEDQLVDLNAEIKAGWDAIHLAADVMSTDVVKDWIKIQKAAEKAKEAEEKAKEAAEEWRTVLDQVTGSGDEIGKSFADYQQRAEQLMREIQIAKATGHEELIPGLQQDYVDILKQQDEFYDAFFAQLQAGLISPEELQAIAEAGGEAFRVFYDGMFGAGALEKLQAGWDQLAAIPVDTILGMLPGLADHGQAILDTLIDQAASGARSWEEVMQVISQIGEQTWKDASGNIVHGSKMVREEFEKAIEQLEQDYAQALLTGADDADELGASLASLKKEYEELYGVTIEAEQASKKLHDALNNLSEDTKELAHNLDELNKIQMGGNEYTIGKGGELIQTGRGDLSAILSSLVGFSTDKDHLEEAINNAAAKLDQPSDWIQELVHSFDTTLGEWVDKLEWVEKKHLGIDQTFADEQLALLSDMAQNPKLFPPALVDMVAEALGTTLSDLGLVGGQAQLNEINDMLAKAGIAPLTADQWAEMNQSVQDAVKGGAENTVRAIDALPEKFGAQLDRVFKAAGAQPGGKLGASKAGTTPQAPPTMDLTLELNGDILATSTNIVWQKDLRMRVQPVKPV